MDRREALRYTALLTGGAIAAPVVASLLSGCEMEPKIEGFVPQLFTPNQYKMIKTISGTLLPNGDIPGAVEVGVPQMIDHMVNVTYSPKERAKYVKGLDAIIKLWNTDPKNAFNELNNDEKANFLTKQQIAIKKRAAESLAQGIAEEESYTVTADMAAPSDEIDAKILTPQEEQLWADKTYDQIRQQTISYYLSTEEISTKYLNYLSVPGKYQPCISLEETGGKAWAI